MIILSHIQIAPLVHRKATRSGAAMLSPDLGLTQVQVMQAEDGITFPDGQRLSWKDATEISESDVSCFALENSVIRKLLLFSRETHRHCSLMPTKGAPTMLIAGFPMHRIKNSDPSKETAEKIKAARPRGVVLDTATGLGYTAIEAAKTASHVITIELDPAVIEIAQENPWSRDLFTNPRIERVIGDSIDLIETYDDSTFDCIVHDPPTMHIAGDLYSGNYYGQLFRILKPRGRLFHYVGDLKSQAGSRVVRGVMERLNNAGFSKVTADAKALGVVALK